MTIWNWINHALSTASHGTNPITPFEQRKYLYDQEQRLEKSVRYQEWISKTMNSLISWQQDQISAIMSYKPKDNTDELVNLWWQINWLWDKINNWLQQINENQIISLKETIRALWIIDSNIREWFTNLLSSMESQTIIFQNVLNQVWEVIETLHNPRKIEWLEYKKDAIDNLQNKWYDEALVYLKLAAEKLITDQEVFYLIWLIEFEENENYEEAIVNFEKANKYAQWHSDRNITNQSLEKLASIYYILDWEESWNNEKIKIAYEYQLALVKSNWENSTPQSIYKLLNYSALVWEIQTFEIFISILFNLDPTYIIASIKYFSNEEWARKIIEKEIEKIAIKESNEKIAKIVRDNYNNYTNNDIKLTPHLELPKNLRNLTLWRIKSIKWLLLPHRIEYLKLNSLESTDWLVLPDKIEYLELNSLESTDWLVLPDTIKHLELNSLESTDWLVLPDTIKYLYLNSLKSADWLMLPDKIEHLELNSLKSTDWLILPNQIKYLEINSLKSADWLVLPDQIEYLKLNNLKSVKWLKLPKNLIDINLDNLISVKWLILSKTIKYLSLKSVTSSEWLNLPNSINKLYLNNLKSVEWLKLPNKIEILSVESIESTDWLYLPDGIKVLDLNNIKSLDWLVLPESLKMINLNSLESTNWLDLPYGIKEVYLDNIQSSKWLILPYWIEILSLKSLDSIKWLTLPKSIKRLHLNKVNFNLE